MKRKRKSTNKAKQPIHPIIRLIQNVIAEYGLESMVVAELFLRLARAIFAHPSQKDLNTPGGVERLTDGGRTTISPVFLNMYLFGDASLTDEHIAQVETAFAFAIPTWSKTDPEAADQAAQVLISLARRFSDLGDSRKREAMSERVLDMCRNHLRRDSHSLALVLGDMGSHYATLGRFDEANGCLQEALTICESGSEFHWILTSKLLSDLATIAMRRREFYSARLFIDQATEILEQAPTANKLMLLGTLIDSAKLFQEKGDLNGFAQVIGKAEMVAKEVWESDPEGAASRVVILIACHKELGRQDDAERLIRWLAGKIKELARETGIDLLDRLIEEMRPRYGDYGLPANQEEILAQIKTERDCPTGQ